MLCLTIWQSEYVNCDSLFVLISFDLRRSLPNYWKIAFYNYLNTFMLKVNLSTYPYAWESFFFTFYSLVLTSVSRRCSCFRLLSRTDTTFFISFIDVWNFSTFHFIYKSNRTWLWNRFDSSCLLNTEFLITQRVVAN